MSIRRRFKPLFASRRAALRVTTLTALACGLSAANAGAQITAANWGALTAPVYNTVEPNPVYNPFGPELFAGPQKFTADYYWGVLPNGRRVTPAGTSVQVGMNPLGSQLTPDGKYLIVSSDDERDGTFTSLQTTSTTVNGTAGKPLVGGYSLTIIDTNTMTVVSQVANTARFFIGLQVTSNGDGSYTIWASGGGDNNIKLYSLSSAGIVSSAPTLSIPILPILPDNAGYVSNYTPATNFNNPAGTTQKLTSTPSAFSGGGAKITFPAGSALSPDGKFLYVACNGDNSMAVIDTTTKTVVKQVPVGYFPYGVSVSGDGKKVLVSNWGITEYKFANPTYDATHKLTTLTAFGAPVAGGALTAPGTVNQPDGFYVPLANTGATSAKSSSVSILSVANAQGGNAALRGALYQGQPGGLDMLNHVGDTHPSGTAICTNGAASFLYVTKANSDSLGIVSLTNYRRLPDVDLSPVNVAYTNSVSGDTHKVHGAYPNAIVVSPDNTRAYVAEAGLNSVAVLDLTNPASPKVIGRIATGWYPTALSLSGDGKTLFVVNAKGVGEDKNPSVNSTNAGNPNYTPNATGIESFTDGNFIFGSVQRIFLPNLVLDTTTVLNNNFAVQNSVNLDTSIVPLGGGASTKIKHVVFILHENKTFDSMLGNLGGAGGHFGPFADTTFNTASGVPNTNIQYTGVSLNTQLLAKSFATAVNYYSDSEESDAGHQFAASGTASDYTEKTLLVKSGRGLLVNKNFEPEDYPEGGYIFNNAARNGISFKDYGAMIRIEGTDTGTSVPASINDPFSGLAGFPQVDANNLLHFPFTNLGDVDSAVSGLGQSYFLSLPILSVLGTSNPSGEPRLDKNYPGYNFNISDQRRAKEFIRDFDAMVANNTLPQFIYLYQPNDHTGSTQTTNLTGTGIQEIADGDVGLGMAVQHIMKKLDANGHSVYYNDPTVIGTDNKAGDGTGTAIFITYDDAQSSFDHIHQHRTPLIVVSPYAKVNTPGTLGTGFVGTRHYVTASVVKTEELLLGLPPNNLGDLFATDLRDLFQPTYNGINYTLFTGANSYTRVVKYTPSSAGKRIWALAKQLDSSAPDRDSRRLGALTRLSIKADDLYKTYAKAKRIDTKSYRHAQANLYAMAEQLVSGAAPRDSDD